MECIESTNLTPREMEVLKLMAKGFSNGEIAESLTISEHTSKAHVGHILLKLKAKNRLNAAIKAVIEGII